MTKQEELAILADTIARLGPDSYLGSWLAGSLPTLADWIRSDIFPPSIEALQQQASTDRAHAHAMFADARKEHEAALARCEEMRREAIAEGHRQALAIKDRARQALLTAIGA
jgi:hypothetical protein